MNSEKYTDREFQKQLQKLDQLPPTGWDMEHSWEKLERMRGHKKMRLGVYFERIAAAILLLAICYGYIRQERAKGKEILVETVTGREDKRGNKPEIMEPSIDEKIAKSQDFTPPNILQKEGQGILADRASRVEIQTIDSLADDILITELGYIDTTTSFDATKLMVQIENKDDQRVDSVNISKEILRPPVIHFSQPESSVNQLNRKFEMRLKKLNRMITDQPHKKATKYKYIGGINLRKP